MYSTGDTQFETIDPGIRAVFRELTLANRA